jgi:hypothetical protein
MLVLRSPDEASRILNPEVRRLVELRFAQVCAGEPYDPDRHGYFFTVEGGDKADAVQTESGCPLLVNWLGDARFGDPDFTPAAEVIEEHRSCYELVFIFSDEGNGIEIFVPKVDGVDTDLLAMCAQFAVPASDLTQP